MKSSMAVFSGQGDPFPTQARARTHYRPSTPQTLNEAQRQTVLSPDRLRSLPPHLSETLSPPDLGFLLGSQRLLPGLPTSDSSEPFDESWPSTEGSSKTPERDEGPTATNSGGAHKQRVPGSEESVLARYIARFRSGCPTSRRDRSPPHLDFWWLQDSPGRPEVPRFRPDSGSSVPLQSSPHILERTPPPQEISVNDSSLCPEDVDIAGLQLRAGKLILRSESSLSSVGPVSSEGLGSSPASNVSSSDGDGSGRTRPPSLDTGNGGTGSYRLDFIGLKNVAPPVLPVPHSILTSVRAHPTPAPEEDILYQWRLRRKMEQAREGTMPVTTRKRSPSPPVWIPKQVTHTETSTDPHYPLSSQGAVQSACAPSQPPVTTAYISHVPVASPSVTPNSGVPPHLHLLCDILPCARSQKTEAVHPTGRHRGDGNVGPQMEAVHPTGRHRGNGNVGHQRKTEGVHPVGRHRGDGNVGPQMETVHPAGRHRDDGNVGPQTEAVHLAGQHWGNGNVGPQTETVHPAGRHRDEGNVGMQTDAVHPAGRHRDEGNVGQQRKLQMEEKRAKPKGERRKRDKTEAGTMVGRGPESPIHQAVEQVISERLFSPSPSPKPKCEERQRRPSTPCEEDHADPRLVEMAAHLLEEAEDSDGADFANDPLLQVLRDQRASLQARLRAVDSRLAELERKAPPPSHHPDRPRV